MAHRIDIHLPQGVHPSELQEIVDISNNEPGRLGDAVMLFLIRHPDWSPILEDDGRVVGIISRMTVPKVG